MGERVTQSLQMFKCSNVHEDGLLAGATFAKANAKQCAFFDPDLLILKGNHMDMCFGNLCSSTPKSKVQQMELVIQLSKLKM